MQCSLVAAMPRGTTLLIAGLLAGLAVPAWADAARPLMPATIFIFVLGTFLRIDGIAFRRALRQRRVWLLSLLAMLACPLLPGLMARGAGLSPELTVAVVLAASAPPSSGTAAIARLLRLDPTIPLAATLLATVLAPLTVPLIAAGFAGLTLDPVALGARLVLLVGGAGATALLLRRYLGATLARYPGGLDATVLTALIFFALAAMSGVRAQVEAAPALALACIALAFACNLGLQVLGALVFPGTAAERLSAGLVLGNRNVGLVWSALGAAVSPLAALYFAATQFPIYITPRLIEIFARRAEKESLPR